MSGDAAFIVSVGVLLAIWGLAETALIIGASINRALRRMRRA